MARLGLRPIGRAVLAAAALWTGGSLVAGAATFVVTTTLDAPDVAPGNGACASAGGGCTLRAAVMEANALAGDDSVQLGAFTYRLTLLGGGDDGGDLDLASNLEIAGNGATITVALGIDRVLEIAQGTASVHDVTLRPLGAAGNPTCILATSPLVAVNVRCDPPILGAGFETGNLDEWSLHSP
jgi:CSLREA domain-containing protein